MPLATYISTCNVVSLGPHAAVPVPRQTGQRNSRRLKRMYVLGSGIAVPTTPHWRLSMPHTWLVHAPGPDRSSVAICCSTIPHIATARHCHCCSLSPVVGAAAKTEATRYFMSTRALSATFATSVSLASTVPHRRRRGLPLPPFHAPWCTPAGAHAAQTRPLQGHVSRPPPIYPPTNTTTYPPLSALSARAVWHPGSGAQRQPPHAIAHGPSPHRAAQTSPTFNHCPAIPSSPCASRCCHSHGHRPCTCAPAASQGAWQ